MAEDTNGERLARVETHLENIVERLDHQDSCVDGLKRQVWLATGAIALLMLLMNAPTFAKFLLGAH